MTTQRPLRSDVGRHAHTGAPAVGREMAPLVGGLRSGAAAAPTNRRNDQ
jgi:hypothetical protein